MANMEKKLFLMIDGTWESAKPAVIKALESGFSGIIAPRELQEKIGGIGKVEFIDGLETIEIKGKDDEKKAIGIGKKNGRVAIRCTDWLVIPLENLVAEFHGLKAELFAIVKSAKEAEVALKALEKGVDGIVLDNNKVDEIARIAELTKGLGTIELVVAKVLGVKGVAMGDRVCVDTCTQMKSGQGLMVGSTSELMFLVEAEVSDNPYVEARSFRVNAGALHMYVFNGERTNYLSELKAGSSVTIVDRAGSLENSVVGRAKIEKRPMIIVSAGVGDKIGSMILQNAETVRVVSKKGSVPVTKLKNGDEILAYVSGGARHFGMNIKESIVER